jgi:nitrous oxide reductase accessory protein NosL
MVKKIFLSIFILLVSLNGANFKKDATKDVILLQKGLEKHWCPISGLSIKKYYKTSHSAKLSNGTQRQYSSIRSLVEDMQEYGIEKNTIKVIDAKTQKLIDANKAFYLLGSKIKGTLSKKSKLAFESEDDAKEFKKKYKGKIVSFNEALKSAEESLSFDKLMTKKKKQKQVYPMGKKLFKHKCDQDIDPTDYLEINELKSALKNENRCKKLPEKRLQAVALYLWEVKRFGDLQENNLRVKVNEHEKCPVCGMFTYKYPKWAAQIYYKEGDNKKHWSFDGVKDLMKFYFDAMKWGDYKIAKRENITKILVTDYYSQNAIDGTKAYYVIRSDIYGPMGHEFIPFESLDDAKTFKKDHFGTKIFKFEEITEEQTYKLDLNL